MHRDKSGQAAGQFSFENVSLQELLDFVTPSLANLQDKDFWVPELGSTTFSPQQTQRISDRLVRIQAERGSKSHGTGL